METENSLACHSPIANKYFWFCSGFIVTYKYSRCSKEWKTVQKDSKSVFYCSLNFYLCCFACSFNFFLLLLVECCRLYKKVKRNCFHLPKETIKKYIFSFFFCLFNYYFVVQRKNKSINAIYYIVYSVECKDNLKEKRRTRALQPWK